MTTMMIKNRTEMVAETPAHLPAYVRYRGHARAYLLTIREQCVDRRVEKIAFIIPTLDTIRQKTRRLEMLT